MRPRVEQWTQKLLLLMLSHNIVVDYLRLTAEKQTLRVLKLLVADDCKVLQLDFALLERDNTITTIYL